MEISAYKKQFAPAFAQLNFAWLNKYFTPEPADFAVLNDLQAQIDAGGMAFFALEEGKVISACLVVPLENAAYAVRQNLPANGVENAHDVRIGVRGVCGGDVGFGRLVFGVEPN